jgi:hypothetical protein
MRAALLMFLLPALLLSARSGVPQSRSDLSEPGETAYDERLIGFWHGVGPADDDMVGAYVEIAPTEDGRLSVVGSLAPIRTSAEDEPITLWVEAIGHASRLDGSTYYNLRLITGTGYDLYFSPAEGQQAGFVILQADVSAEDQLFLRFMSPRTLAPLIEDSTVRGRSLSCGDFCGYILLDVSRQELIDLIRSITPEKLFPVDLGPFQRINLRDEAMDFGKWYEAWTETFR